MPCNEASSNLVSRSRVEFLNLHRAKRASWIELAVEGVSSVDILEGPFGLGAVRRNARTL